MFSKLVIIATAVAASGWNYKKNGEDWALVDIADNKCGTTN